MQEFTRTTEHDIEYKMRDKQGRGYNPKEAHGFPHEMGTSYEGKEMKALQVKPVGKDKRSSSYDPGAFNRRSSFSFVS